MMYMNPQGDIFDNVEEFYYFLRFNCVASREWVDRQFQKILMDVVYLAAVGARAYEIDRNFSRSGRTEVIAFNVEYTNYRWIILFKEVTP